MTRTFILSVVFSLVCVIGCVNGHGFVSSPRVRGTLGGLPRWGLPLKPLFPGIGEECTDHGSYWPSGDKRTWLKYAGIKSQRREGKYNWTPYEPTKKGFIFRTGVCGDEKKSSRGFPEAHLKGGRFYCPAHKPYIVKTYEQGGVLDATVHMVAHHNGFMEFVLCDVKYCKGGEISEDCLREGKHCQKLKRLYEPKCETRLDQTCAPIDPNYPERWYMPCSPVGGVGLEIMQHIRFKLPNHVTCDHCVLQWYWAAGNVCNPPGFAEFFKGPRGPKWKNCPGQAESRGGYASRFKTCGGKVFAEEYYSCSDIAILPKKNKKQPSKKQPNNKQQSKKQPNKKQPSNKQQSKKQPSYKQQSNKQQSKKQPRKELQSKKQPSYKQPSYKQPSKEQQMIEMLQLRNKELKENIAELRERNKKQEEKIAELRERNWKQRKYVIALRKQKKEQEGRIAKLVLKIKSLDKK